MISQRHFLVVGLDVHFCRFHLFRLQLNGDKGASAVNTGRDVGRPCMGKEDSITFCPGFDPERADSLAIFRELMLVEFSSSRICIR